MSNHLGWRFAVCLLAATAVAGAVLPAHSGATSPPQSGRAPAAGTTSKEIDVYATYYGWYDNTPPGCATAYSGCAGGTGSYSHPITFASDKAELPVGTIVYYPTVEKYFVMGDDCQECDEDWAGQGPDGGPHLYHVDLWIGGNGGNEFDVINCEDALTQGTPTGAPLLTPFIVDPPSNMPVSTEPLFNTRTGHCFGGATTSTSYGRYANAGTGSCLEDPGDSSKPGTLVAPAPCTKTRPAEDIAFDGAFFTVHRLCLQSEGYKPGDLIDLAACTGGPEEQWEVNPNGTITGIQYGGCLGEVSGKIEVAKCGPSPAVHWRMSSEPAT